MDHLHEIQRYLERHHGGDGPQAAQRALESHERNHDQSFRAFWQQHSGLAHDRSQHLVDLGCGPALFLQEMAEQHPLWQLTGIECAPYMLEKTADLPEQVQIRIADLNAPGDLFAEASLDGALANRLIHELHQPVMLFRALASWLKPGGRLILVDMVRQPLKSYLLHELKGVDLRQDEVSAAEMHDLFLHYLEHNRYHPQDLCDLLEMCGLEVLACDSIRSGRAVQIAARRPL